MNIVFSIIFGIIGFYIEPYLHSKLPFLVNIIWDDWPVWFQHFNGALLGALIGWGISGLFDKRKSK